jgi:hypothetical protein
VRRSGGPSRNEEGHLPGGAGGRGGPLTDRRDDQGPVHSLQGCAGPVAPDRSKQSYPAVLNELLDGVFVKVGGWGHHAFLVWGGSLLLWSPGGYMQRRPRLTGEQVTVLTPGTPVAALRAGYAPEVHGSAGPACGARRRGSKENGGRDTYLPYIPRIDQAICKFREELSLKQGYA